MINLIINKFINDLNTKLLEDHNNLTCKDIRNAYIYLTDNFKEYFGSKSNFSGFTELLLLKILEGWILSNDTCLEVSAGGTLSGKRTYFDKYGNEKIKTQQSDIKLMKGNKIEYYFSVKAIKIPQKVKVDAGDLNSSIVTDYFKNSLDKETEIPLVLQDFNRIENVRHSEHENFKAVTIFFSKPNDINIDLLNKIKKKYSWYDYICLNDINYEKRVFIDVLNEKLNII
ncbi:hypothetical protein [Bacillus wiedmannii]|uniref:hypothetical protein n=1 Tax=Bacillus wiedmannii TaxID=1890302 RepID=UPI000BF10B91|nr:hypothetical protein [Bacillus wiedmannii]PEL76183.1 hypothetical protein CN609_26470 [Bacillus wiedmannii]